jgi:hypothetical protein
MSKGGCVEIASWEGKQLPNEIRIPIHRFSLMTPAWFRSDEWADVESRVSILVPEILDSGIQDDCVAV